MPKISIIPGGVIQFLELEIDLKRSKKLPTQYLYLDAVAESARNNTFLLAVSQVNETGEFFDVQTGQKLADRTAALGSRQEEPEIRFTPQQVVERVEGIWLPLPFFRTAGLRDGQEQRFRYGPTDWVRAKLDAVEGADECLTYKLTVAVDTEVMDSISVTEATGGNGYPCLAADDVLEGAEYQFFPSIRDNWWFVEMSWLDDWLKRVLSAAPTRMGLREPALIHRAIYLSFLELLSEAAAEEVPSLRLVNPDAGTSAIDVDLVLDIGNSRSIGMLVEHNGEGQLSLDQGEIFQLRDLSRPFNENRHGTFSSHLCFSRADFGDPAECSLQAGRNRPGFSWPSPARVGDEAERLANAANNSQGQTSSSSPKRYLWDMKPSRQEWRFAASGESDLESPVNTGDFVRFINDYGMPLAVDEGRRYRWVGVPVGQPEFPVTEPRFCRSSLMMFFIAELITQALSQIFSPEYRMNRGLADVPRRLRTLILTTPPAMPIAERKIFENWVYAAIDNVWRALEWDEGSGPGYLKVSKPRVRMQLDEASATQLVFIYDQIHRRFSGDAQDYFERFGKRRDRQGIEQMSLRVASIDIGGGTTDMVVTTYHNEAVGAASRLTPHQEFREGFNFAGDELLRVIIERHILPSLGELVTGATGADRDFLHRKFGQNVAGLGHLDRNLRAQFTQQILVPIALKLMQLLERLDVAECHASTCQVPVAQALSLSPSKRDELLRYGFSIRDEDHSGLYDEWVVAVRADQINQTLQETIIPYMRDLGELIHEWDCDFLLLAGRPSRLPIIQAIFQRLCPVLPSRLVPMSGYQIGSWYPFWLTPERKIDDPKTTCVVGALVSSLAEGGLQNFFFNAELLQPASTIKYVGTMDNDTAVRQESLLFDGRDISLIREEGQTCDLQITARAQIGFRQMSVERWKTTPLYHIGLTQEARTNRLPYTLTIEYVPDSAVVKEEVVGVNEGTDGLLRLVEIRDRDGQNVPRAHVDFQFRSLWEDGHWLDTGLFTP